MPNVGAVASVVCPGDPGSREGQDAFPVTAVTNDHKLGRLNNTTLLLDFSGGQKSKMALWGLKPG